MEFGRNHIRGEATMDKIIGTTTTYIGTEHAYLVGYKVRIVAIIKGFGSDNPDKVAILQTDEEIEAAGSVAPRDRVEVQPWIQDDQGGHWSFVTSDPLAADLECFAYLTDTR